MLATVKHLLKWKRRQRKSALNRAARTLLGKERFVAVDIGAAYGLMRHWATVDQVGEFYLFEPNRETSEALRAMYAPPAYPGNFRILPVGLSGKGGKRTLNVTNVSTGSSLLELDEAFIAQYCAHDYFFPVRKLEIETRSLSEMASELGWPHVDMIKLDTQGTELEILQGLGNALLSRVLAVELEVGVPGAYIGQATLPDVQKTMEDHGLVLFDLRCNRTPRPKLNNFEHYQKEVFGVYANSPTVSAKLFEVDAVFFRDPRPLLMGKDGAAIRRLLAAYCTYNFFAEAYYVAEEAISAGAFAKEEGAEILKALKSWHNGYHRRFHHSAIPALAPVRKAMYRLAHSTAPRWAQYIFHEYPSG